LVQVQRQDVVVYLVQIRPCCAVFFLVQILFSIVFSDVDAVDCVLLIV
jgi:hypothetical protein